MCNFLIYLLLLLLVPSLCLKSNDKKCDGKFFNLTVDTTFFQNNDFCDICECKLNGNTTCNKYTECSQINCEIENDNYLLCCLYLGCRSIFYIIS